MSLLRKTKKNYYSNLGEKDFNGNRQLKQLLKTLLLRKTKSSGKIILVEQRVCINFSICHKNADIAPIFKKGFRHSKDNYQPVSVLPLISKLIEKLLWKQIAFYKRKISSEYPYGFRKRYITKHHLLAMLEKWKKTVDNGNVFGALLTDLSKTFDCFPHNEIIAKLNYHGFNFSALKLTHNYLAKRKQRIKINHLYSSWEDILFGIPQRLILGPILFNICLADFFSKFRIRILQIIRWKYYL